MTTDTFDLAFPQPGWVVLDAIRHRGFTGSVFLGGSPAVRVFADQGDIYWAEEVAAPSVGARLVDAGAITAVQLERGAVRHADVERLERLFERVPAIERDAVVVVARALAEQSLVGIARQTVVSATAEPYVHHTSGIHLWNAEQPVAGRNTGPSRWEPPKPATVQPAPVQPAPVQPAPVQPSSSDSGAAGPVDTPGAATAGDASPGAPDPGDFTLVWNDEVPPLAERRSAPAAPTTHVVMPSATHGDVPPDGVASAAIAEPGDEFEIKWPSGAVDFTGAPAVVLATEPEVGDPFDASEPDAETAAGGASPDPLAAVVSIGRSESHSALGEALSDLIDLVDRDLAAGHELTDRTGETRLSPDQQLAVRSAVAAADTGLLDARRRLMDHRTSDRSSRGSSESLRSLALSGDVDPFGGTEERDELDDLADGSPALRRIMGNLRRV
ncbi:MAG TPA: hypothetical protein VMM60_14165 [Ilumatobacter sp.]|nr:hypothetical protein [Ilumatobacter sp.]